MFILHPFSNWILLSLSLFLGCRSVAVLPSLLPCLILKARSSNNFFPFDVKYHHRPDKYIKWSRSQQMSQKPSKRNGIIRVHQRGDSQTQKYSSEHLQAEWIVFSFSVIQRLVFFLLVARFGSVENRREYFNVLFSHCGRDNRKKICWVQSFGKKYVSKTNEQTTTTTTTKTDTNEAQRAAKWFWKSKYIRKTMDGILLFPLSSPSTNQSILASV